LDSSYYEIVIWDSDKKMRQVIGIRHHVDVTIENIKALVTSLKFEIDSNMTYEKQYNLVLNSLLEIPKFSATSETICMAISTECAFDTIVNTIKKTANLNEKIFFRNITQEDVLYEECTALHVAASGTNLEPVKTLCKYGSYINARTENNETPLHIAVQNDNTEMARLLLELGADVNQQDINSFTPLEIAKSKDMIELLQSHTIKAK